MYLQNAMNHLFELNILAGLTVLGILWLIYRKTNSVFKNPKSAILWDTTNAHKRGLFVLLFLVIGIPAMEELIFRAPLLILFTSLNSEYAYLGIILSSMLFGLIHYDTTFVNTDNNGNKKNKSKMIITFFIGLVLSWSTIYFQSIIIPLIIHGFLNLPVIRLYFAYIVMEKDLKKFDDATISNIIDDYLDPSNQLTWYGLVAKYEFQKQCLPATNTD